MSELGLLPEGWAAIKIEDIADVKGGKRLPKGESFSDEITAHPFFNETIDMSDLKYLKVETHQQIENYTISKNDLYISIAGTIGLVGSIPASLDDANLTENAAKICNISGVDKVYLQGFLNSQSAIDQFKDKTTSSGQPKLALFRIRDCDLLLPPLAEQKVIADKLDELLAQVESTKARLDAIPAILKSFRQSVFAAAVSGKLTEKWRDRNNSEMVHGGKLYSLAKKHHLKFYGKKYKAPEPLDLRMLETLPQGWVYGVVSHLVEPGSEIMYGIVQPGPKLDEGIPYVRGTDIQNGQILVHQLMKTSPEIAKKYERATLSGNDILLGIIRATKVAIVPDELKGANITQGTARLRAFEGVLTYKYLAIYLESPKVQSWLHSNYRGIDMPGLNLKDVRRLPIALPSKDEQSEIVRRVEDLFAFADKVEAQVKEAQTRVNNLTQSILAKAFRGELTQEWRAANPDLISGENSASALLERIKASRSLTVKKPKKAKV
jgi:type I restriction enzyme S subunit